VSSQLDAILRDYVAAWNEPDDVARVRRLEACVVDDVRMVPGYKPDAPPVRGRDELSAEIGVMVASRPAGGKYRLALVGEPDAHHGWARFRWRVADPAGAPLTIGGMAVTGLDVVQVADDGRLETIVVFLG